MARPWESNLRPSFHSAVKRSTNWANPAKVNQQSLAKHAEGIYFINLETKTEILRENVV